MFDLAQPTSAVPIFLSEICDESRMAIRRLRLRSYGDVNSKAEWLATFQHIAQNVPKLQVLCLAGSGPRLDTILMSSGPFNVQLRVHHLCLDGFWSLSDAAKQRLRECLNSPPQATACYCSVNLPKLRLLQSRVAKRPTRDLDRVIGPNLSSLARSHAI